MTPTLTPVQATIAATLEQISIPDIVSQGIRDGLERMPLTLSKAECNVIDQFLTDYVSSALHEALGIAPQSTWLTPVESALCASCEREGE